MATKAVTTMLEAITGNPTIVEIKAIARALPYKAIFGSKGVSWYDHIRSGGASDWGLLCITLAHMAGYTTHRNAYGVGEAIGRAITGNAKLEYTVTKGGTKSEPKLVWYSRGGRKAGVETAFGASKAYAPKRFGERTKLGERFSMLVCETHGTQYQKCAGCSVAVRFDDVGGGMLAFVRSQAKGVTPTPVVAKRKAKVPAKRKATKANKAIVDAANNDTDINAAIDASAPTTT